MITKKEAIKRLYETRVILQPNDYIKEGLDYAIDYLEGFDCLNSNQEVAEDTNGNNQDNKTTKAEWIHCDERLPEKSGYYLVTNTLWGGRRVDIDSFSREGMFWFMTRPVAWMPLPEPYEEVILNEM